MTKDTHHEQIEVLRLSYPAEPEFFPTLHEAVDVFAPVPAIARNSTLAERCYPAPPVPSRNPSP
jgi:hypothetical protein